MKKSRKRVLAFLIALLLLISNVGDLNLFAYASAADPAAGEALSRVPGETDSIVGPVSEVVRRTYRFHTIIDDPVTDERWENYEVYRFTDDHGAYIYEQTVTDGELPVIPRMTARLDAAFSGWYRGEVDGEELILEDQPFDFDNPPLPPDGGNYDYIDVYARYRAYAYVVFHESESENSAIAFIRRVELDSTGQGSMTIGSDLTLDYGGTGQKRLLGWRLADENEILTTVELSAGRTDLYPVFESFLWLNYYTELAGTAATYVPSEALLVGEPRTGDMTIPELSGYDFGGWYSGPLDTSTGEMTGVMVADRFGRLNSSLSAQPGFSIIDNALYITQNLTLYAKWTAKTSARYRVLIWTEKKTDAQGLSEDDKRYDYWGFKEYTGSLPGTVSVSEVLANQILSELNPAGGEALYVIGSVDGAKTLAADGSTVLNVKLDRTEAGFGSASADTYTLSFVDSMTPAATMPEALELAYNASAAAAASGVSPRSGHTGYNFRGWFMDPECTLSVSDYLTTMPDRDVTVYAGWEEIWYLVKIDPNYGAMYHYNDSGVLEGTGATWMWKTRESDLIQEYTHVTRDFVESDSGEWYYVNRDYDYYGGVSNPNRQTFYTRDTSDDPDLSKTYEYVENAYLYVGWYEVLSDGREVPFDFSQHITHDTTLKLHWKKAGDYYIQYEAGVGRLDSGGASEDVFRFLSEASYTDNAEVLVLRSATPQGGFAFAGWKVRGDTSGKLYGPGETFILHSDYAVRTGGKNIIYLDAVYTQLPTAKIVYDANGGSVSGTVDFGSYPTAGPSKPLELPPEPERVQTGTTATISNLLNSCAFVLSSGEGFAPPEAYPDAVLLGWSREKNYDPAVGTIYAPGRAYGEEGYEEYVVNDDEPVTLYAVWGVRVSYDLNLYGGTATWDLTDTDVLQDDGGYYQMVPLNTQVTKPATVPVRTDGSGYMFYYWTGEQVSPDHTPDAPFDFTRKITAATTIYAYWSGPKSVTVKAAKGTADGLVSMGVQGTITVGADPVDPATQLSVLSVSSSDYGFDIAVACDQSDLQSVAEEDAVDYLYYNSSDGKVWLHFKEAGREDLPMQEDDVLWFIYHEKKQLHIGYNTVAADGALSAADVSGAAPTLTKDKTTGAPIRLGEFDVREQLAQPLSWVVDTSTWKYFSYAVGKTNADTASDLKLITDYSASDGSRPALRVRNSWNGFHYSVDGGSSWVNCGFDVQLYVVYFKWAPTLIRIWETTFGTASVPAGWSASPMETGFNYTVEGITDTPLSFTLSSGESRTVITYYRTDAGVNNKTVKVTQAENTAFTTKLAGAETRTWTYTPASGDRLKTVSFNNYHKELTVTVHVAVMESGRITVRDVSGEVTVPLAALVDGGDPSTAFLTALSPETLFAGNSFSSVICGTDNGTVVTARSLDVASVSYEQIEPPDGSDYEPVLYTASGAKLGILDPSDAAGGLRVYYLYCEMPTIRYVKEDLSDINPVTNRGQFITLNGVIVKQNQPLSVPGSGLVISQQSGSGYFHMPMELDDRVDGVVLQRYLRYTRIGVRGADGEVHYSDELTLHLRIQSGKLQYSFNGTGWADMSESPVVYAVYSEYGYELTVNKTVDMSVSGEDPVFTEAYFTLNVASGALTEGKTYAVEGGENSSVTAEGGKLSLRIRHGDSIKIKGLPHGEYTITELDCASYEVSATGAVRVSNGSFTLTMDSPKKVALLNTPRPICQTSDNQKFYTLQSAFTYAQTRGVTEITMLLDYTMPAADMPHVDSGYSIVLKGNGKTVSRGSDQLNVPMITNEGSLTLSNLTLDGAGRSASAPMILQRSGSLTIDSGTVLTGAVNSGEGGAIRVAAGDVTIKGGSQIRNNRAGYGGAIASLSGSVILKDGAQLTGNRADQDGGAIWAASGTVTIQNSNKETAVSGNTAAVNGGAIYLGGSGGSAALTAEKNARINNNTANGNGSAIYVNAGSVTFTGDYPQVTGNVAGADGGAVAVVSDQGRLYFSGKVKITGNTNASGAANVWLGYDTDLAINDTGLQSGAVIGVYVPDTPAGTSGETTLFSLRGNVGTIFGTYTDDGNAAVSVFKNDLLPDVEVTRNTDRKKLIWGKPITVQVMQWDNYAQQYPSKKADGNWVGTTKWTNTVYPTSGMKMSELADSVYQTAGLTGAYTFAFAFYDGDDGWNDGHTAMDDYLTEIQWDEGDWKLIRWDGSYVYYNDMLTAQGKQPKLIIYYSQAVYLSIENNTEFEMEVTDLTVNGKSIITTQDPRNAGASLIYAKNGTTQAVRLPAMEDDLRLGANDSIRLLIPGGAEMTYSITARFDIPESDTSTVRFRHTKSSTDLARKEETPISAEAARQGFTYPPSSTTTAKLTKTYGYTYELIFGGDRSICKITTEDGTEHLYSTIKAAIQDAVKAEAQGGLGMTTEDMITVEMLSDYLMNESVDINKDYHVTLTTAKSGAHQYPGTGEDRRATISRDAQNTKPLIKAAPAQGKTSLTVTDLIFDGKGVGGKSGGGLINTRNMSVVVDNCEFRNCLDGDAGALCVQFDNNSTDVELKSLTVKRSVFTACESLTTTNRKGGGAIYTESWSLDMEDCKFINCKGVNQAGGVFHKIDKGWAYRQTSKSSVRFCEFTGCSAQAGGGLEIDAYHVLLEGCSFVNCTATQRNGGGMNLYIQAYDSDANMEYSELTVKGCYFEDCATVRTGTNLANGGAFRSFALVNDISDCVFKNSTCTQYGGGAALTNKRTTARASLTHCSISGCTANAEGGGLYCVGQLTVTGGKQMSSTVENYLKYPAAVRNMPDGSSITGNYSKNKGGGLYISKDATLRDGVTITGNRISGSKENGAGIYFGGTTLTLGVDLAEMGLPASYVDTITVDENYTDAGELSNVWLPETNNKTQNANCVVVNCGLSGRIGVVNAKKQGTQFGRSIIEGPAGINDSDPVIVADDGSIWGIIQLTDPDRKAIIWGGPHVCRITDANDVQLFFRTSSIGAPAPAVFDALDDYTNATDTGISSAFALLRYGKETWRFCYEDGTNYVTDPDQVYTFKVKMLTDVCKVDKSIQTLADNASWQKIILTTETMRYDKDNPDTRYGYHGKAEPALCTLERGSCKSSLLFARQDVRLENIVLDGKGVSTNNNTGALCKVEGSDLAMLTVGDGAVLQNGKTNKEGGGVHVLQGGLKIVDSGTITNCTGGDGGGVYFNSSTANATFLLSNGKIEHCVASSKGGGVHLKKGAFTMTSGSIQYCTAQIGSAVMVNSDTSMTMSGGSIRWNEATYDYNANGGAICVGNANVKLYFSGKPIVSGNKDKNGKKSNVLLSWDRPSYTNVNSPSHDGIINVSGGGLVSGAYIGVRVWDAQMSKHGLKDTPFGTIADGTPANALYGFANDENAFRGSLKNDADQQTIYWAEVFALQVTKQIEGFALPESGGDEEEETTPTEGTEAPEAPTQKFHFTVTLQALGVADMVWADMKENDIVGDFDPADLKLVSKDGSTLIFEFTLQHGQTLTVMNLPKPVGNQRTLYTVTEDVDMGTQYAPVNNNIPGRIGGATGEEYISSVIVVNRQYVCKITDEDRTLLYYTYTEGGGALGTRPAVYTTIAAALADIKAGILCSNAADPANSGYSGKYHIEMLVPEYTVLEDEVYPEITTLDGSGSATTTNELRPLSVPIGEEVTLTTALMDDGIPYPYTGELNSSTGKPYPAVIYRGYDGFEKDSLLTVENLGILNLTEIILDGNKDASTAYTSATGGGLVQVGNGGKLYILEGATLQNSRSSGNGGAVAVDKLGQAYIEGGLVKNNEAVNGGAFWLASGGVGFIGMSGGSIESNEAVNGGAFYLEQGGQNTETWAKAEITGGSISGNTCTGSGGAFYLDANSKLDLRGGTVTLNTSANHGGAVYAKGTVKMIASNPEDPLKLTENSSTGDGGAIYLASGASLEMSAGTISQNESKGSGGAVYVASGGAYTLSGGVVNGNTIKADSASGQGAGIYLATGSTLTLSGSPDFGGPGCDKDTNVIDTTAGNFNLRSGLLEDGAMNGKSNYTVARQDIYLAEDSGDEPATLHVKSDLTGTRADNEGSIWVWAEKKAHYEMRMPFARMDEPLSEAVGKLFRNAQTNELTLCSDAYLYGVPGTFSSDPYVYWSGGVDIYLKKVDGYGDPLAGATFALYDSYKKALEDQPLADPPAPKPANRKGLMIRKENGDLIQPLPTSVTSKNRVVGGEERFYEITFNKDGKTYTVEYNITFSVAPGVYYMKEINKLDGYRVNPFVYRLVVGLNKMTEAEAKIAKANGVEYVIQRVSLNALPTDTNPAVDAVPDVFKCGIVNLAEAERKVIMKNADSAWRPLVGGKFDILCVDRSPYWYYETVDGKLVAKTEKSVNCVAGSAGSFWIGMLPFGTYYIHQTLDDKGAAVDRWYLVDIPEDSTGVAEVTAVS